MKKGTFGDIQANTLLGDVNANLPRLIFDEAAWDDLQSLCHSPETLVRYVFDDLRPETQRLVLDIMGSVDLINRQYGDPFRLDFESWC